MIRAGQDSLKVDYVLGHWIWAVPILLAVALLAVREIDRYPPSPDEYRSMNNVGWVADGPFAPIDVLQSLARNSPGQAPLYYLILNVWGSSVPQDIALARLVSIYCGLLFLATSFRLIRDFVDPVCAPIALVVVASNAFLNLYFPHARMYQLLLLVSALALWSYLRIVNRRQAPRNSAYAAFFLSCLALASTHAASIFLFLAIGAYHILCVPKGKRWLRVVLCVGLALLIYSPWTIHMVSEGVDRFVTDKRHLSANGPQLLASWAEVLSNGNIILLLLPAAGLLIAWRRRHIALRSYHLLIVYYLAVVILAEQSVGVFSAGRLRYLQPGFLLLLLAQAAGLYALYRIRRWLGLLALLWIMVGGYYQHEADWRGLAPDRSWSLTHQPFHSISRAARLADARAIIITYKIDDRLIARPVGDFPPPLEDYFNQPGLDFAVHDSLTSIEQDLQSKLLTAPSVWAVHQPSLVDQAEADALAQLFKFSHYQACESEALSEDSILTRYKWIALSCAEQQSPLQSSAALIDYKFFGAGRSDSEDALAFSDEWHARADALPDQYRISHQLLSEAGKKVAQLDLPLVHEGMARQFTIDIGRVPAGRYRLVAILYDRETRERFAWTHGDEQVAEMLTLAVIEL